MTRAPRVVVVGGPTAGGKSALAVALAERVGGELIGADSRQLYAGLQLAAAGPTDDERARAPHHLYGTVPPTTTLSAGRFVELADAAIADVVSRGRVAIVVGGTGLYLRALRLGLPEASGHDAALRQQLTDDLHAHGLPALLDRLRAVDDAALIGLDTQNPVRVVRALELALLGTNVASRDIATLLASPPRAIVAEARWLLVSRPPAVITDRINARARTLFATDAVVNEARALASSLSPDHPLLQTIGVAEALAVARGELTRDIAAAQTATRTRQYARRQRTWFKKETWWASVNVDDGASEVVDEVIAQVTARATRDVSGRGDTT